MKIFIYKTIIIIFSVFLLVEFTIGKRLDSYNEKLENLSSKQEREKIIEKVKDEIAKANKKENILTESEQKLLSTFINKIRNELDLNNKTEEL